MKKTIYVVLILAMIMVISSSLFAQTVDEKIEALASQIGDLQKMIVDLQEDNQEKDSIISLFKEQQESVYRNAENAIQSMNDNVSSGTATIAWVVCIIAAILGIGFPITAFIIQSRMDKKRIEQVETRLDELKEEAEKSIEKTNIEFGDELKKVHELAEKAFEAAYKSVNAADEAKKSANEAKVWEILNQASIEKDADKRLMLYTMVLNIEPTNWVAFNQRGLAYIELKGYDRAIDDFKKAISFNEKSPVPYNNRGNLYYELQKYKLAIDDFEKVIELNPLYPGALRNSANLYRITGNYTKAIDYAEKAVAFYRNSYEFGTLAEIYSDMGKTEEFYKNLETALEKGYPLLEALEDDPNCKSVYDKHKDEERFKTLMEKYSIEYPED